MRKFKKILFIHFGTDGGTERFFLNLARGFGERGIEQKFIIRPERRWRPEIEPLGEIIEHNYRRISISSFFLEARVKKLVKKWEPDVIMAFRPRAARLIPDIEGSVKLARMGDFPTKLKNFRNCDVLVGIVPSLTQTYLDLGWSREVATIANFPREVDVTPISREKMNTPDSAFVVIGVGRFTHTKGFDTLIRAVNKVPDGYLWLLGEGPENDMLRGLVNGLGMSDRVRFTGWKLKPQDYLASADVFCLPSRDEPLGNVTIEAYNAGLPVVATRVEGPNWFMEHNKSGYMVDVDDVEEMANGLNLIRTNDNYTKTIKIGGQKVLNEMFSKHAILDQYTELFEKHLNANSPKTT